MTRWALLMLMVLMVGRVFIIPATPIPTFQLSSHHCTQATPYRVTSEKPSTTSTTTTTKGPSASRSNPSSGPRPGPLITLSLDVPLGLLQILLEEARIRASQEQAAANARILAHVGRR
ncbi:urocortin-2 [Rhynchocyon petersi]